MTNFLTARWENLIMANYVIDPAVLESYLPAGTEPDYFEGKTYVSLVGFMFLNTKIFGIPAWPFHDFEEINLRFYVTRKEGGITKRGVVFINETVPHRAVAWLANRIYREKYIAIPTKHHWNTDTEQLQVEYYWKVQKKWNHLKVSADGRKEDMRENSIEEFIFEHYYGYTKISTLYTDEYKVEHPRWQVHAVSSIDIDCDFEMMYGKNFSHLADQQPSSVMLATGSPISVKWKRSRFQ